jgi:hypothetical protein
MIFDFVVFGHDKFNIVDHNLFKKTPVQAPQSKKIILSIDSSNNLNETSWASVTITVCTTSAYCEANGGCDAMSSNGCPTDQCWISQSWGGFIGPGVGGAPSSGGGSTTGTGPGVGTGNNGGSAGGTYTPPTPNCSTLPEGCTPGWLPTYFDPNNPCEVLDSLLKTNNFPLYLQDLRNRTAANHEFGYIFLNPLSPNSTYDTVKGPNGTLGISIDPSSAIGGALHNHYNDSLSLNILSADDIYTIYDWLTNNKIANLNTFTQGMVSSNTSYIAMVNDSTAFVNFGNKFLSGGEDVGLNVLQQLLYAGFGIHEDSTAAQNEKNMLKAFESYNTGLTLFRGSTNLQSFSRIALNANANVINEPCLEN